MTCPGSAENSSHCGLGKVEATTSGPMAPCHNALTPKPFSLLLMHLVLPLNLGFVPGFSLNCLSFHFSLSRFLMSPICCLRSFVLSCKTSLFSGAGAQLCVPSLPGKTQHLPASLTNLWHPNLVPWGTINALVNFLGGRRNTDVPCLDCSYCRMPCPAAAAVPLSCMQWFLRFQ